ncbi:serine/threonine protein phosphatase [bacterium 1XD8-76]|nr:serine/threonine protein phosphatase [bacterium 1XD8-76]
MAVYVISDIHGEYDKFMELLDRIGLKETDMLYILGDVLDRGPDPIRVICKLMEMPNVIPIVGNHEVMAITCLDFLCKEITEETIAGIEAGMAEELSCWMMNGSMTTIEGFCKLDRGMQKKVIDYIREFLICEELTVNGKEYLLVHAGLGNFSPEKELDEYTLDELVWERQDYEVQYFEDKYIVTGHTPTQYILGNPRPGFIFKKNHHIAIDCGSYHPGGRLAAICLDTGEEFYTEGH